MVTAGTQRKRIAAEKKEAAAAEAKIAKETEAAVRRAARKGGEWPCTAEQIIHERDARGLSWRQVAVNLNLGSPGQARKAYTALTGKPHYESAMTGKRASRGTVNRKVDSPNWNDDSDQDEIIERLQGKWHEPTKDSKGHYDGSIITVACDYKGLQWEEEVQVARVKEFAFEGKDEHLVISVFTRDTGALRCFRVDAIKDVK